MKRIKKWFWDRFLPMWAKETLLADYKLISKENELLRDELSRKDAYIDGLLAGLKSQRRIVINTTEGKR